MDVHRANLQAEIAWRESRTRSIVTRQAKRDAKYLQLSPENRELYAQLRALTTRLVELKSQIANCRPVDVVILAKYDAYVKLGYPPPIAKPVDKLSLLTGEYVRVRTEHKHVRGQCSANDDLRTYIDYCRRIESDIRKLEYRQLVLDQMRVIIKQQEELAELLGDWMPAAAAAE